MEYCKLQFGGMLVILYMLSITSGFPQKTKDYLKNLYMAAPMHDIGKIAVPDVILQKPAKLTEEEFEAKGNSVVCQDYGNCRCV